MSIRELRDSSGARDTEMSTEWFADAGIHSLYFIPTDECLAIPKRPAAQASVNRRPPVYGPGALAVGLCEINANPEEHMSTTIVAGEQLRAVGLVTAVNVCLLLKTSALFLSYPFFFQGSALKFENHAFREMAIVAAALEAVSWPT